MISTVSSGRVLVTGFGPFGSERVNPSGLIAARLGGVVLPVVAEEAWIMTREEMKRRRARAVLALGVAGGRAHVCVEKQAVNEAAYPIADDAGRVLHGPLDALQQGIAMIHQELNLMPGMSVAENIWIGREPLNRLGLVDHRQLRQRTQALFDRLAIGIDPGDVEEPKRATFV